MAVGQHTQELLVTSIHGGLYDWIGLGIKAEIFPPIIFLGVGALTDFGRCSPHRAPCFWARRPRWA